MDTRVRGKILHLAFGEDVFNVELSKKRLDMCGEYNRNPLYLADFVAE